jgi:hypothetical protein
MITSANQGVLQKIYQLNIPAEIPPAFSPPSIRWTWKLPLLMYSDLPAFLVNTILAGMYPCLSNPMRKAVASTLTVQYYSCLNMSWACILFLKNSENNSIHERLF